MNFMVRWLHFAFTSLPQIHSGAWDCPVQGDWDPLGLSMGLDKSSIS